MMLLEHVSPHGTLYCEGIIDDIDEENLDVVDSLFDYFPAISFKCEEGLYLPLSKHEIHNGPARVGDHVKVYWKAGKRIGVLSR